LSYDFKKVVVWLPFQHVARQVRWMAAGGGGCRVRAPGDCRVADGFGKQRFFTLQYSDANTDTGRGRKEVP